MLLKKWLAVIVMTTATVPVICFAVDPVPLPPLPTPPDAMTQAFQAIRDAMERSDRMGAVLGNMTTPEVYGFYTRRNDLYKHNLMKALGAYDALIFLRSIEEARNNDAAVIMNRLRTEADPVVRAALIARLPQSAPFVWVEAETAIRKRLEELTAETAKLKAEEIRYREDRDRIERELTAAKRRVPRDAGAVNAILEDKWKVLNKIEAAHRRLVEVAIEGNLLRDYAQATNKDAKIGGIARGLANDLRLFTGEVRDGKPVGGMRELWADIQENIAERRQAIAMPFQPGQSFFLKPPTIGNSANPLSPGFIPPTTIIQPAPTIRVPFMQPPLMIR